MKRRRIPRRKSEKYFSKAANHIHKKNMMSSVAGQYVMRGGIRL